MRSIGSSNYNNDWSAMTDADYRLEAYINELTGIAFNSQVRNNPTSFGYFTSLVEEFYQ